MIIVGLGFGGNLVERLRISRLNYGLKRFTFDLESTDAAPEVLHSHSTRLPTRRSASAFFFFSRIRADAARFAPMRLDSCQIGFDLRRTGLIRPKSGRIGHIGSYWPAADMAETGRKRPKLAGNG